MKDTIYIGYYSKYNTLYFILYFGESCGKIAQILYKNIDIELNLYKSKISVDIDMFKYIIKIIGTFYNTDKLDIDNLSNIEHDIISILYTYNTVKVWNNDIFKSLIEDISLELNINNDEIKDCICIFINYTENKIVVLDNFQEIDNIFPLYNWHFERYREKNSFNSEVEINEFIKLFNNSEVDNYLERINAFKILYSK